jgi:hypothetical protein
MNRAYFPNVGYANCRNDRGATVLLLSLVYNMTVTLVAEHWAIPLFSYTPLQMTINGVQGGIGNMSQGLVM